MTRHVKTVRSQLSSRWCLQRCSCSNSSRSWRKCRL